MVMYILAEQDMLFDKLKGLRIPSTATNNLIEIHNPICRHSYCSIECTTHYDCVAYNAKLTQPCQCELFLSLNPSYTLLQDGEWITSSRIKRYQINGVSGTSINWMKPKLKPYNQFWVDFIMNDKGIPITLYYNFS